MPCTRSVPGYLTDDGLDFHHTSPGKLIEVPCGKCPDCRQRMSRDWAIRIMHEAREYEANSFLTLTYANEHLPEDLSLNVRHWQLFAKKLRKRGIKFRYYHVGEYGKELDRPHYHAAIFGVDFLFDRKLWKEVDGHKLYTSPTIEACWPMGHHSIGSLTPQSAAYISKYMSKKDLDGSDSERYERFDPITGEVWSVKPEYATMSKGGKDGQKGIGHRFIKKYWRDVYNDDAVVLDGNLVSPPKYYNRWMKDEDPEFYETVIERRCERASKLIDGAGDGGRAASDKAREIHTRAKLKLRKESL